ncbi:MAG: undecaprenyldiphospho-muramoylpentapeptide beta-N-acetylglucosaminyltransferase [Spirochaetaceae bacterium]|jgi:UDP-N-acetylglucosamine--N-acetylmuramyl-(pentapeptide) pyrophosphoryl-undecaprenol N-acetylglucosamine transferase|nr:undecaprenyldiphospho-muramoylpentapeptide beta-N-acetylglucosaminyltransferase [Spirochaetaceae bacterium]
MSGGKYINRTVVFTGGGTGGHIYPAIATASALKDICDCRIVWIGFKNWFDRSIVEGAGIKFEAINGGKLRRYFSLKNFTDIFRIAAGFFASLVLLKKYKPALIFSKGGFVSVPPSVAAAALGIPVFTHESDFSPGLATRINARLAKKIFITYEQTKRFFKKKYFDKIILSGNPVRSEFYTANPDKGRALLNVQSGEKILLVLGGSQGAEEINSLIESCLAKLTEKFFVVHQTGRSGEEPAALADEKTRRRYIRLPYIGEEMPDILAAAALVLGRSGAGTVWECAAVGRPMALIPLTTATRGDQIENARFYEEKGAARVIVRPNAAGLLKTLDELLSDEERLTAMAAAAAQIGTTRGATLIARHIFEFIGGSTE